MSSTDVTYKNVKQDIFTFYCFPLFIFCALLLRFSPTIILHTIHNFANHSNLISSHSPFIHLLAPSLSLHPPYCIVSDFQLELYFPFTEHSSSSPHCFRPESLSKQMLRKEKRRRKQRADSHSQKMWNSCGLFSLVILCFVCLVKFS